MLRMSCSFSSSCYTVDLLLFNPEKIMHIFSHGWYMYLSEKSQLPLIFLLLLKVGGNNKAKAFFKSRPDFRADMSINEKYNSKAAALYRDKVMCDLNQR